ncbi:hypothetical protein FM131_03685 [Weissella confusa]|nr:hypothetical protein FM131_03685 [Weissella confusa]
MAINGQSYVIPAGSLAKFNGAFPHVYQNDAMEEASFISLMIYDR